jgi:hypothetical protein
MSGELGARIRMEALQDGGRVSKRGLGHIDLRYAVFSGLLEQRAKLDVKGQLVARSGRLICMAFDRQSALDGHDSVLGFVVGQSRRGLCQQRVGNVN